MNDLTELRNMAPPELLALIDAADAALPHLEPICSEQLECLLDPAREDDALGMVDDWQDRVGIPETICEALREWIADRHHVNARG